MVETRRARPGHLRRKSVPPQNNRARWGEAIKAGPGAAPDFTVDWVHLKLNDRPSARCCARTRSARGRTCGRRNSSVSKPPCRWARACEIDGISVKRPGPGDEGRCGPPGGGVAAGVRAAAGDRRGGSSGRGPGKSGGGCRRWNGAVGQRRRFTLTRLTAAAARGRPRGSVPGHGAALGGVSSRRQLHRHEWDRGPRSSGHVLAGRGTDGQPAAGGHARVQRPSAGG